MIRVSDPYDDEDDPDRIDIHIDVQDCCNNPEPKLLPLGRGQWMLGCVHCDVNWVQLALFPLEGGG